MQHTYTTILQRNVYILTVGLHYTMSAAYECG